MPTVFEAKQLALNAGIVPKPPPQQETMTKAKMASSKIEVPITGIRKKSTACKRYIVKKTHLQPIASESQGQSILPAALPTKIMLTTHAAVAGPKPDSSCTIGSASEMKAIPGVTLRNSIVHKAYHCHVLSALPN